MNLIAGVAGADGITLTGGVRLPMTLPQGAAGAVTLGVRAGTIGVRPREGTLALAGSVELAEISGSDTFVHVATPIGELVAQLTGVHVFTLGEALTVHIDAATSYVFDAAGDLLVAARLRHEEGH
jgi:glycerol transport system ATP-binding protein